MNKINKFFKTISGRPKDGDIIECIKPFIFYPQIAIAIWAMYEGFINKAIFGKFLFAFMACIISWQAGWGMSIERFVKHEQKENDKTNEK